MLGNQENWFASSVCLLYYIAQLSPLSHNIPVALLSDLLYMLDLVLFSSAEPPRIHGPCALLLLSFHSSLFQLTLKLI